MKKLATVAGIAVLSFSLACGGGGGGTGGGSGGAAGGGTGGGSAGGGTGGGSAGGGTGGGTGGGSTGGGTGGGTVTGGQATFVVDGGFISKGSYTLSVAANQDYNGAANRIVAFTKTVTGTPIESRTINLIFPKAVGTYPCDGGIAPSITFQEVSFISGGAKTDVMYAPYLSDAGSALAECEIVVTTADVDAGSYVGTFNAKRLAVYKTSPESVNDAGIQIFNGTFTSK